MIYKVWVIERSGRHTEEVFNDAVESLNFAKARSLRSLCSFRSSGKDLMVFEHGEKAGPTRTRQLMEHVTEMADQDYENYARGGRGKPSRKKQ